MHHHRIRDKAAAGQNQGNNGNAANPDPFANNGKPIDISDDDLPF